MAYGRDYNAHTDVKYIYVPIVCGDIVLFAQNLELAHKVHITRVIYYCTGFLFRKYYTEYKDLRSFYSSGNGTDKKLVLNIGVAKQQHSNSGFVYF